MNSKKVLERYLRKVIDFCQVYDAFSIPAAMMAGGPTIKLPDVYTQLSLVERSVYEKSRISLYAETFSKTGNNSSPIQEETAELSYSTGSSEDNDIDSRMAEIDKIVASLSNKINDNNASGNDNAQINNGTEKADVSVQEMLLEENLVNQKTDSCPELSNKIELNWVWYLSAPGGGKTTLLKMYCLAFAFKYYIEVFGRKEDLFEDWEAIERICDQLGVGDSDGACPFFISVRELKEEDYPNIVGADGFKNVVVDTIRFFVGDDLTDFNEDVFFENTKRKVYLIDSVEEFSSYAFRNDFLLGLDAFSAGDCCLLSSRYREYVESVKEVIPHRKTGEELLAKKELVIELKEESVRDFAEKWYTALNNITGRKKLNVDKDFLIPLHKNKNVKYLISNPLELTSLLMISSYDSYLPSDYAKIYGRSIELWINWNNHARYNYEDIMRQLSQIAYQMAISETGKIIVSEETLKHYILQARKELKRYYQQVWPEDEKSINDFIKFLCSGYLLSKSTDGYDFFHRQYQAYLVAYCISTQNFPRETRRKSKFEYIEEHIREKDDFWNQIYTIVSTIDIELRDDIIATLFELASNEKELKSDNYYVSRLIDLAITPGVNFDQLEREMLINLMIQDDNRWTLFDSKQVDFRELLNISDEHNNGLFINAVINKYRELSEKDKDSFRDKVATSVFFCIWQCAVEEQHIRECLLTFFSNFISSNVLDFIFASKELTEQQILVKEIALSIGRESIERGENSDCFIIVAAIIANDDNPYACIDDLINKKSFETNLIAINVLIISAWLIRCKNASRYGLSIDVSELNKYASFVSKGILDNKHDNTVGDYLAAFLELFAIGTTNGSENLWFCKEQFDAVLRIALSKYKEDNSLFDVSNTSLNRYFEHVSLYPCVYKKYSQEIVEELNIDLISLVEKLKAFYTQNNDIINRVQIIKLLILLSDINYDERMEIIKELEKQSKRETVKQNLKNDDLQELYNHIINQIKQYNPEGQELLDELDFENFRLSIEESIEEIQTKETLRIKFNPATVQYYYSEGRYEDAKKQYLLSFSTLESRNNLAYMLRRGEIESVHYGGIDYSVEMLLQDGIDAKEPYSIINYALHISCVNGHYDYKKGLYYLMPFADKSNLLDVAIWWHSLKQKGDLEGYVVCMWLCDLGLDHSESIVNLKEQVEKTYSDLIEF